MASSRGGGITYIDGNNLMGGAHSGRGRDDRDRFLDELLKFRLPRPSCVVFDGPSPGNRGPEGRRGPVRIIYAAPDSADTVLRKRVRPGDTVVTSDFALQGSCRAAGARILSGPDFLRNLKPLTRGASEKPSGVTESELEAWIALFGAGGRES